MGASTLTIDRWIAAISSVGTLVAAFLAYFSIREVRLQRVQQFQPRLTPISAYFGTITEQKIAWKLPENPNGSYSEHSKQSADYSLPLINVGNGVAADIEITWTVDLENWMQSINTLSAHTGAGIGIQKEGSLLSILVDGDSKSTMNLDITMKQNIEYVLPVVASKLDNRITVPLPIQALIQTYYECYFKKTSDDRVYTNPTVGLNMSLDIKYKDTVGRTYSRRTIVDATVVSMIKSQDKETGVINYEFKPVRNEPPEGDSILTKALMAAFKEIMSSNIPYYKHINNISIAMSTKNRA